MNTGQLYLKPEEGKFLAMAVLAMLEDLTDTSKNEIINWTPEARKDIKSMIEAGNGLRMKLIKLGFNIRELPPYLRGDEDEFLTKQS
jgi:hypothetical protein